MQKILIIGGSGNLGNFFRKSEISKKFIFPSKKKLNLLNENQIYNFLKKNKIKKIINCAALARIEKCEKFPHKAIKVNLEGTLNLVNSIKKLRNNITLIHISTDAVYPCKKGNYSENSKLAPSNVYGWTKLGSEYIVKTLNNYIIIRTRFFNKKKNKFKKYPTDIFTSKIDGYDLILKIMFLINNKFQGIINIGSKYKKSEYAIHSKIDNKVKKTTSNKILKNKKFKLGKDCSLNITKFLKFKKNVK